MEFKHNSTVSELIDNLFSLQWCKENLICPLQVYEKNPYTGKAEKGVCIAVANFSYLGTIGDFITRRCKSEGLNVHFTEEEAGVILSWITRATIDRQDSAQKNQPNRDKNVDRFSSDKFIEVLKGADAESENVYEIDYDESDEYFVEKDALSLDFAADLNQGTWIQQAASTLLIDASMSGVSDIHVEPRQDDYKVRVRQDGVMQGYASIPRTIGSQLVACLKNMAQMDIAERRHSQDGKIRRHFEGQTMEFRCATAPGKFGEKMVMRFLNSNTDMLNLDTLITNNKVREDFRNILNEANGIIIVSGPTGSGKSTTLASALREKDSGELNMVTAEDPIEYDLGGNIQQFPVIRAKGQTFVKLLRIFLRQDPDVILIGETRDPEIAESCMDAAETGHLVFTTLHANSAASSVTRLMDMELPGYKLNASLRGVMAQRLLRRVCPECSVERPINEAESYFTGLPLGTPVRFATALSTEEKQKRKLDGTLCSHCGGTGYKGRVGTYELMKISKNIRDSIKAQKSTHEIECIAVEDGMLTLRTYAIDLIEKQLTTISELKKISNNDEN
ncbi:GspE/PulE family protein [Synechococcus sp. AH-558-M21]|nr:GspE/PulE family protein [Synechococcus sp. AH-558-M21]